MKPALLRPVALLLLLAATATGLVRAADAPAADPAPALLATINRVLDLVSGKTPDEITASVPAIRDQMTATVAIDAIVQRSFGRNWSKLTDPQKTEAIDLLGRLMIRTYATQLATGERPKITLTSSRQIAPERWEVITSASTAGKNVSVIYRLAPIGGGWKAYDILGENLSLVGNYRQQFDEHFEHHSAEDLLVILRQKLAAPVVAAPPPAAK
jgi:phospholipid transport system substrate-binding protein